MGGLKLGLENFGIKNEGWGKAAHKPVSYFERVENGVGGFMRRKWHDTERSNKTTA